MEDGPTPDKVICGVCNQEFPNMEAEHAHVCPVTGFTPTDFEFYVAIDPGYEAASQAALERGAARANEEVHPAEQAQNEADVAVEVTE